MTCNDGSYNDIPHELFEKAKSYRSTFEATVVAYCVLAIIFVYHIFQYFDYPPASVLELVRNLLAYILPAGLLPDIVSKKDTTSSGDSDERSKCSSLLRYAWSSEAVRRIVGLDAEGIMNKVQLSSNFSNMRNFLQGKPNNSKGKGPPGLGNWDNSCYQNSVIQGLASLPSLLTFLRDFSSPDDAQSTKGALSSLISQLNDPSNAGTLLWTPSELKSMSSWQQQDAQEYFSKVFDEVEREISKIRRKRPSCAGLADLSRMNEDILDVAGSGHERTREDPKVLNGVFMNGLQDLGLLPPELMLNLARNPLEGLLAQRVGCLECGYVEGLSLIPFNCLTVPLGQDWMYDVRSCLDEYTILEPISGVECAKCTLLYHKNQLRRLLLQSQNSNDVRPAASPRHRQLATRSKSG